jgi:hypothetical protein
MWPEYHSARPRIILGQKYNSYRPRIIGGRIEFCWAKGHSGEQRIILVGQLLFWWTKDSSGRHRIILVDKEYVWWTEDRVLDNEEIPVTIQEYNDRRWGGLY